MQNIYESQEFFEHIVQQWMRFLIISERWAASYGLTIHSFWVLYNLFYTKAGLKQVELVKITMLSKQTISYLTDCLIKRGYVVYQREGNSRRVIVLTAQGNALVEQILKEVFEVGLYSMRGFSVEESQTFDQKLTRYIGRTMEGFSAGATRRLERADTTKASSEEPPDRPV